MLSLPSSPLLPVPLVLAPGHGDGPQPAGPVIPASPRQNETSGFKPRKRGRPSGVATILLAPGTTGRIIEAGDRFTVLSTNLPVEIQPQPAGRAETYYQGLTGKFADPFDFLIIKNKSATSALVLSIWIGFEDLANYSPALLPASIQETMTVIASTGVIQPVSTLDVYFRKGWFYGYGSFTAGLPNNNAANINLGKSKTFQPDQLAPGQYISYEPENGQLFNLANIYVQGTAGDGIFFTGT